MIRGQIKKHITMLLYYRNDHSIPVFWEHAFGTFEYRPLFGIYLTTLPSQYFQILHDLVKTILGVKVVLLLFQILGNLDQSCSLVVPNVVAIMHLALVFSR